MATALLNSDILTRINEPSLIQRITKFASLIDKPYDTQKSPQNELEKSVAKYLSLSSEKTTDAARRKDRQVEFVKAIDLM
jgi:hypothetical protein